MWCDPRQTGPLSEAPHPQGSSRPASGPMMMGHFSEHLQKEVRMCVCTCACARAAGPTLEKGCPLPGEQDTQLGCCHHPPQAGAVTLSHWRGPQRRWGGQGGPQGARHPAHRSSHPLHCSEPIQLPALPVLWAALSLLREEGWDPGPTAGTRQVLGRPKIWSNWGLKHCGVQLDPIRKAETPPPQLKTMTRCGEEA